LSFSTGYGRQWEVVKGKVGGLSLGYSLGSDNGDYDFGVM